MAKIFRQTLVLHQWLLELLSASVWERDTLCNRRLKEAESEPWGEESPFLGVLLEQRSRPVCVAPDGLLKRLDADIVQITRQLGVKQWLYFQYIAMLFAGMYLDAYYADREKLLQELNLRVRFFNASLGGAPRVGTKRGGPAKDDQPLQEYALADLARMACWQATGSGKTLLLHANRLQVFLYSRQYEAENRRTRPDAPELLPPERTILITPNRMLVTHHADEARALGFDVTHFDPALPITRESGKSNRSILGASISQFQPPGEKHTIGKVPPEYFPGRNLVLVDEGHRGSSKVDSQWRAIRLALAQSGFLIEYSATLEQAAQSAELRDYYARSIYIDYSYPKFYKDGYGKHFKILSLDTENEAARNDYLVASLLAFHQQLAVFEQGESLMRSSNIERPLMLFAGRTVTGETKQDEDKYDKVEESDIISLMRFMALFVSGADAARPMLADVLRGKPGILTKQQVDLFASYYPEITERDPDTLYTAMLSRVFRAAAPGRLTLEVLKDSPGEVAVKVGDAAEFFAVINVGKPDTLAEKLERADKRIRVRPTEFRGGLFGGLKALDNRLTMLIGSKKFAEGWSSWRVSQIGLLHIGRGEGTQVIQLFGRGVRLKGKGGSLKRSTPPWEKEALERGSPQSRLRVVETLNVFAVKAEYLQRFNEQVEEVIKEKEERAEVELPIIKDERVKGQKLRVPVPPSQEEFAQEVFLTLDPGAPPTDLAPRHARPIVVDFTPRVQYAGDAGGTVVSPNAKADLALVRAFADHDALYAALVEMKNRKQWTNLALPRTVRIGSAQVPLTRALLADEDRFSVQLPSRYVNPAEVADLRHMGLWTEIARKLVTAYADGFYKHCLGRWQTQHAKIEELDALDAELIDGMYPPGWRGGKPHYEVSYVAESAAFTGWLGSVEAKVRKGGFLRDEHPGALGALSGTRSLYHPLLYRPARPSLDVRVRPVALNDGEERFVHMLHQWLDSGEGKEAVGDAEVFLLRNLSRSGLGFFVGRGFYPDFIVWVLRGKEQWISFVDPKGLVHIGGEGDGKVRLAEDLRELEARVGGGITHLDSWIWSVTPSAKVDAGLYPKGFLANHVLFDENGARAVRALFRRASRG